MVLTRGGAGGGSRRSTKLAPKPAKISKQTHKIPPSPPIQVEDDEEEFYIDIYGNYTRERPTHPTPPSSPPRMPRFPAPPAASSPIAAAIPASVPPRTISLLNPTASHETRASTDHDLSKSGSGSHSATSGSEETTSDPTFKDIPVEQEEESAGDSDKMPLCHVQKKLKGKMGAKRKYNHPLGQKQTSGLAIRHHHRIRMTFLWNIRVTTGRRTNRGASEHLRSSYFG